MKRMKKMFAMFLALAMVLGMSVTSFAATKDTATITVSEVGKDATLKYTPIIVPAPTEPTGWKFAEVGNIKTAYITAFTEAGQTAPSEQDVIKQMIDATKAEADPKTGLSVNMSAIAGKVSKALASLNIPAGEWTEVSAKGESTDRSWTVNNAGVYAITASETGFTYSAMAAYVGFGEVSVDGTEYSYPSLKDASLTAKKSELKLEKGDTDEDKVVAIGDIVTFTITTNVPSIPPTDTNKTYFIHDKITGATYHLSGDKSVATITMAGETVNGASIQLVENKTDEFYIDLSSLIDDANSNAGKQIVVTYTAKVTAVTVENEASAGHKTDDKYGSEFGETDKPDKLYTGKITLLKYDEKDKELENKPGLEGAGFEVTLGDSTTALKFIQDKNGDGQNIKGSYTLAPDAQEGKYVTEVFTGEDGNVIIHGLNIGTYKFTEKTAPKGYSINATPVTKELTLADQKSEVVTEVNGKKIAQATIEANTSMSDTRLASLPSTGGIGTTIFTIGGCAIMILAAGLYFASRRKSAK